MYLAKFRTQRGPASLPIDRATVLEGMRLNGFNPMAAVQAMNNMNRGIPVIIGECSIEWINPKAPKWN